MKYLTVFDSKYKYKFQYSYYQAIFSVPLLLILDSISLFETTKVENLFFDEQFKFFWNIPNLCYHYHFCLKERERERDKWMKTESVSKEPLISNTLMVDEVVLLY